MKRPEPQMWQEFERLGNKTLGMTTWSAEDLGIAYSLYNLIYESNKKDSGCPSCRRSVISGIRNAWKKYSTI